LSRLCIHALTPLAQISPASFGKRFFLNVGRKILNALGGSGGG